MGFWSSLGNIAGGFIGDPHLGDQVGGLFGGGSSSPSTPAGNVGLTAADIEKARLNGLVAQTTAQQRQDQLAQEKYLNEITGKKFELSAPGQEAANSARGDVLANAQDATISGLPSWVKSQMPTVTGGLRPGLLSDSSRQLGSQMSRNALLRTMNGSDAAPTNPDLTALPSSTKYDAILQGLSTGGGFLNAISGLNPANTRNPGQIPGGQNGVDFNIDTDPENGGTTDWSQLPQTGGDPLTGGGAPALPTTGGGAPQQPNPDQASMTGMTPTQIQQMLDALKQQPGGQVNG